MSEDFDIIYENVSPCCGESLHWEWNDTDLLFDSECGCMKRYHLKPITAVVEHDREDFEEDED